MSPKLTVVLSRSTSHDPSRRDVEDRIIDQLRSDSAVKLIVMPELYHATKGSSAAKEIQEVCQDMLVISWLSSRATHWTLHQMGIHGLYCELGSGTAEGAKKTSAAIDRETDDPPGESKARVAELGSQSKRTISHIELTRDFEVSTLRAKIHRLALDVMDSTAIDDRGETDTPAAVIGRVDDTEHDAGASPDTGPERRRWYPVIDFSRCTNCMECIDFCLFGVYGIDDRETIIVEQPDNCRQGCPACSRVCPDQAIIFPLHQSPAISGRDDAAAAPRKLDLSQLFGSPDPRAEAEIERDQFASTSPTPHEATQPSPPDSSESGAAPRDELDRLMDEVDESELD